MKKCLLPLVLSCFVILAVFTACNASSGGGNDKSEKAVSGTQQSNSAVSSSTTSNVGTSSSSVESQQNNSTDKTPTPHNGAKKGEIAKTVILPGDPLRAKYVAENFLEDAKCVNEVRGALCYTGKYKGKEVSVMGSGMGMPSIGIYSYELFNFYDVDNIIRIGSAGGWAKDLKLKDLVLAMGSCYDSNYANQYNLSGTYSAIASYKLLRDADDSAKDLGINVSVGNVFTTDAFYKEGRDDIPENWKKMGVLCVEMEAAALYMNAARAGKNALTMLTISDLPLEGKELSYEERQKGFDDMIKVSLEVALKQ